MWNAICIILLLSQSSALPPIALVSIPVSFVTFYVKHYLECFFRECCLNAVSFNRTGLKESLSKDLHGQHITSQRVFHHVSDHLSDRFPVKPLVFSFHGYTGVGKNFVANMIVNNILKMGIRSRFYHFYDSLVHFKHASQVDIYKEQLHRELVSAVAQCPFSIFVFDEMHNMPAGLLDVLAPMLEMRESLDGVDFRRSTFIFLSNSGGSDINRQLYEHLLSGKLREDFRYTDVDRVLATTAYNSEGGLRFSQLISKHLITAMIPFLPLQVEHVRKCIYDVCVRRKVTYSEEMVNFILDELEWSPEETKFFSVSGCKRVYDKVGFYIQQM